MSTFQEILKEQNMQIAVAKTDEWISIANWEVVYTSRSIAKKLDVRPKNVIRDIEKLIGLNIEPNRNNFILSDYKAKNWRTVKQYLLNKEGIIDYLNSTTNSKAKLIIKDIYVNITTALSTYKIEKTRNSFSIGYIPDTIGLAKNGYMKD